MRHREAAQTNPACWRYKALCPNWRPSAVFAPVDLSGTSAGWKATPGRRLTLDAAIGASITLQSACDLGHTGERPVIHLQLPRCTTVATSNELAIDMLPMPSLQLSASCVAHAAPLDVNLG